MIGQDNGRLIVRLLSKAWGMRSSVVHLAFFWFFVWPCVSILTGAVGLAKNSTTQQIPFWIALPGVAVGTVYLVREFLISAMLLFLLSSFIFLLFPLGEITKRKQYFLEPAICYLGLCFGVALEYPAVLNNALFTVLRHTTLIYAYASICLSLLVLALLRHGIHRKIQQPVRSLLPCVCFVFSGWAIVQCPIPGLNQPVNRNSTVILGIDSLGVRMATPLRILSAQNGGAFYEKAVTPGLLTNAVWTAIISHRPVRETGTLLTFQSPDWQCSPYQLILEAKRHGFQTWSFFTGQNTIYVGSLAGFDHDRSGPMGWLQNATSAAKNGSILAPLVISRLPLDNVLDLPPNQAGTYTYDLRALVRSILTSRDGSKPVFAVSHIGYLHDEAYPRFADLPRRYRSQLLHAQVDSVQDLGADWQLPAATGDSIDLNKWKINNVQEVVADELRKSGFLDPGNNNRLILISDHGMRSDLTNENFGHENYYHVPMITFGLPARNVLLPISLLDIPNLIGLEDPSSIGPAIPAVEYVNISTINEFRSAILGGHWLLDGRINFSPEIGEKYLDLLKTYNPVEDTLKQSPINRACLRHVW